MFESLYSLRRTAGRWPQKKDPSLAFFDGFALFEASKGSSINVPCTNHQNDVSGWRIGRLESEGVDLAS
jgi:hypothetical protein